jgi:alkanesulfonate monooxygenase SsuD/methylene tetrahydromethanopterin reductase-like flavin-dependent oxidoreductase (luciferase family)
MRFRVHLPQLGRHVTRDALLSFARRCEECGYDSLWVSDHVAWPSEIASVYPYGEDGAFPGHGLAWLDELSLSLRWYLDPDGRMDPDVSLAGSPAEMRETLESLGATGVSDVVLDPVAPGGPAARLDAVERFWHEVAT